jgi:Transposase IS116/IS110/IS902 family
VRPEERSVAIREEEYALERLLAHLDFLEQSIALVQQEIQQRLEPYEAAAELLGSIPTVGEAAIATIISEIGVDRERFPSDKHVASWAGGCLGNYESAGKRLLGKTPHGMRTCEPCYANSPGSSLTQRGAIYRHSTIGSRVAVARNGRS